MDSESGFTELTDKEKEVIRSYLDVEVIFMPKKNFFRGAENIFFRRHAVAIISKLSRRIDPDTLIPYLAMNYFDRVFSMHYSISQDIEGHTDTDKVRLIALACLTISAKMRIKDFSIDQFLITCHKDVNMRISHLMVMRAELLILSELEWEILSVTPLTFLDFYYRYFKTYGGFKRRCINEIIVQAQGEHAFAHYYPSVITISAFLAASRIAYPTRYREIATPFTVSRVCPMLLQDKVTICVEEMLVLCSRLNILIETPKSGIPSTSKLNENQKHKGKEVMVEEEETPLAWQFGGMSKMTKTSQALKISEGFEEENKKLEKGETSGGDYKARVEAIIRQPLEKGKAVVDEKMEAYISEIGELEERKSLMNFELKWPEDVPPIELQSQTDNRSKPKGRIRRTVKKLTSSGCKIG